MKAIPVAATLFAAFVSYNSCFAADVLVYKSKQTFTRNGVTKEKFGGFTLIDLNTQEIVEMSARPATRTFTVYFPAVYSLYVIGAYSIYSVADGTTDVQGFTDDFVDFAKGKNTLTILSGRPYNVPKVWTQAGHRVNSMLTEWAGTLTLDAKVSAVTVAAEDDLDTAIERVRNLLISQGYVEE
jgi:hypothetical protein